VEERMEERNEELVSQASNEISTRAYIMVRSDNNYVRGIENRI